MYILFRFSFFLLFGVEIGSDRFWIRVYLLWNGGANFCQIFSRKIIVHYYLIAGWKDLRFRRKENRFFTTESKQCHCRKVESSFQIFLHVSATRSPCNLANTSNLRAKNLQEVFTQEVFIQVTLPRAKIKSQDVEKHE